MEVTFLPPRVAGLTAMPARPDCQVTEYFRPGS